MAAVFADNRILTAVSKGTVRAASAVARSLSLSTDALIVLMRKTVLRERVVADDGKNPGFWKKRISELRTAYEPIIGNFSFALMLSCIGMMMVFGAILLYLFYIMR